MAAVWLPSAPLEAQIIHRVPYFLSASHPTGQGFLRISNWGDRVANLEIRAVDDAGVSGGSVSLRLDPDTAIHFNSDDLERGNPGKGLVGSAGQGEGDWRLEIETDVDGVDVGSFVRTVDTFLTGMGQEAVPYRTAADPTVTLFDVPIFNPDRNPNQRSRLRITNRESHRVTVYVDATDDAGMQGQCNVQIAAGATNSYTAHDLEQGTVCAGGIAGWGSGTGKWYVLVGVDRSNDDITVVNLLESASGHVTNLSLPLVAVEGTGGAGGVDDHPNSGPGTRVSVPSTTAGSLETGGDEDYFRFSLSQSGEVTVYSTGSTDTVGRLIAVNRGVAYDNDDSGSGNNFHIVQNVSAGDYDVRVRGYSNSETGDYGLHVEFSPGGGSVDHPDLPPGTAVNVPSVTNGELEYDDRDWFRITLNQAGRLTAYTSGNVDTDGIVQAADGSSRWENDDDGSEFNFRIEVTVQPGDYDIGVKGWGAGDTGSYQLHLEFQRQ